MRTEKWSYIQYGEDASGGMELFDMETDPKQFNNLAQIPHYADIVRQMKEKLKSKLKEVRTNDLDIQYDEK